MDELNRFLYRLCFFCAVLVPSMVAITRQLSVNAFWIALFLVLPSLSWLAGEASPGWVVCESGIAIVLRDKLQFIQLDNLGWWIGFNLMSALLFRSLAPSFPISWQLVVVGLTLVSGMAIRPERSLLGFFLWIPSLGFLLLPATFLYFSLALHPERHIFPYVVLGRQWKLSPPRSYPISVRPDVGDTLCERCKQLTTKSKLIMGSRFFPFVRSEEWHDFWPSFEDLRHSAFSGRPACHVCCILWSSCSEQRRRQIIWGRRWLWLHFARKARRIAAQQRPRSPFVLQDIAELSQPRPFCLKVKIWDEAPGLPYLSAQLFRDDTPIGSRLVIDGNDWPGTVSSVRDSTSTSSDHHIILAKQWLQHCQMYHPACKAQGKFQREPPTRLICITAPGELGGNTFPVIRLVVAKNPSTEYVAFSHCWGGSQPFKLLQANYHDCLFNIDFDHLSRNCQDAVRITLALGYSYLWIDSLCIIQDSKADWKTQAAKMGDVYDLAVCTIASTGSSSGDGGCFHQRDPRSLRPCKIATSSRDQLLPKWTCLRREGVSAFVRGVDRSPLNKRAWVFQERLLSHRILHFGDDMLFWECRQRVASELDQDGYVYRRFPQDFKDNYTFLSNKQLLLGVLWKFPSKDEIQQLSKETVTALQERLPLPELDPDDFVVSRTTHQDPRASQKHFLKRANDSWRGWEEDGERQGNSGFRYAFQRLLDHKFLGDETGADSFTHCWYQIVQLYSRGNLTFPTDKLVAISGIVRKIETVTGCEYLAGLWKESLITDLLWFAAEQPRRRLIAAQVEGSAKAASSHPAPGKQSGRQIPNLIAPTWSWASLEGPVATELVPQNTRTNLRWHRLASLVDVKTGITELETPAAGRVDITTGVLHLSGPLCKILRSWFDLKMMCWRIEADDGRQSVSAMLRPDISMDEDNLSLDPDLFCLPCLAAIHEERGQPRDSALEEVQGLVLRRVGGRSRGADNVFLRVGFFTTGLLDRDSSGGMFRHTLMTVVCIM
ncbi:HET-domain-containing protein [Canariomyces notabilis]|uniref:HET-domain-containing protein n=1 Tax=Canariomyces notabilis TaxID=2074819 RepID=A0AAN6QC68_9PEZI|nr:HET-domain-containing protein [Canariomyces arenarius]